MLQPPEPVLVERSSKLGSLLLRERTFTQLTRKLAGCSEDAYPQTKSNQDLCFLATEDIHNIDSRVALIYTQVAPTLRPLSCTPKPTASDTLFQALTVNPRKTAIANRNAVQNRQARVANPRGGLAAMSFNSSHARLRSTRRSTSGRTTVTIRRFEGEYTTKVTGFDVSFESLATTSWFTPAAGKESALEEGLFSAFEAERAWCRGVCKCWSLDGPNSVRSIASAAAAARSVRTGAAAGEENPAAKRTRFCKERAEKAKSKFVNIKPVRRIPADP